MGRNSSSDRGLQPGDLFGDYKIVALAGKGGMGVVYKATHVRLRRLVALKLLRGDLSSEPGFEDRFLREAALAASIKRHANVVIVYDSGVEDDRLFLAMEWVDGDDLRSILSRDGRLAPAKAVAIVHQTANALEAVHATMVHRDVKPANIMVSGTGEAAHVYLTDFGIARPTVRGETLTQEGVAVGTPGYVSPEQAIGRDVDKRADLYALGCVFFEAISGKSVCSADDDEAPESAHAQSTTPSLVPVLGSQYEPFDRFLAKALAIDRDGRYSSASEFATALEVAATECARSIDITAVSEPDPPKGPRTTGPRSIPIESEDGYRGGAGGPRATGRPSRPKRVGNRIAFITLATVVLIGAALGILALVINPKPAPIVQHSWQKPVNLRSGPLGSGPTAGVDADGGEYVFWAGTNGALWDKWQLKGRWYGPGPITAARRGLVSPPAVAVHADGQQDVFWKRANGSLWEISHTSAWQKPVNLGSGPMGSGPTAGVDGNGGVYVFWEGANGTLWEKWQLGEQWSQAAQITAAGDRLSSQPPAVAVHAGGQQDVFWKGTDGKLWEISHTTAWQKPVRLGSGPLGSGPTAGVDADDDVYVFWEGTNGTLWEKWELNGRWGAPGPITRAGDEVASQPAVAVHADGQLDVFWKRANGTLWEISHTGRRASL